MEKIKQIKNKQIRKENRKKKRERDRGWKAYLEMLRTRVPS